MARESFFMGVENQRPKKLKTLKKKPSIYCKILYNFVRFYFHIKKRWER